MTEITDLGGGLYHIDSFFDVFTELAVGTNLVITFDGDVQIGAAGGKTLIKRSDDDSVVEIIDVNSPGVTVNGAEVTINPLGHLAEGTGYYVQIDPGAIEDLAGNGFAGITDRTTWNFNTAAAEGIIPVLTLVSVDRGSNLASFTLAGKPLQTFSIMSSTDILSGFGTPEIDVTTDTDGNTNFTVEVTGDMALFFRAEQQ